ncbi:MAG: hypothetical protein DRP84_00245 [Spirochaetes bacterium]|nr:MAG: hypothetical protein DRP84_00245 [Spirochaetota bacterium]
MTNPTCLKNLKWKLILITILFFIVLFFSSCKSKKIEITRTTLSMGTFVQIDIVTNIKYEEKANSVIDESFKQIKKYDAEFDYRKKGDLNRFNRDSIIEKEKSPQLFNLIQKSIIIAKLTNGAFDPTIYPLVKLWGFDDGHPVLPSVDEIKRALKNVNYRKVKIVNYKITKPSSIKLDLSAIAKGYIVDLTSRYIKSKGFTNFLINAGGDIFVSGFNKKGEKWKIAIQDPFNPDKYSGILNITNSSVVTSGDYENFFIKDDKKYCHILNPKTGYPPFNMHSVTIISEETSFSDAVATAVFVMGPDKGFNFLKNNNIRGLLIFTDQNKKVIYKATNNFWE